VVSRRLAQWYLFLPLASKQINDHQKDDVSEIKTESAKKNEK